MKNSDENHNCLCEHNHEHVHENVSVHLHEGAVITTGEKMLHLDDMDLICGMIDTECKKLNEWIREHKGFIGHIKGCVKINDKMILFSTTGKDITIEITDIKDIPDKNSIMITAIIFGLEQNEIKSKINAFLKIFD